MIQKIENEWKDKTLDLVDYKLGRFKILQGAQIEEYQLKLDEHRALAGTIHTSATVQVLIDLAADWESRLSDVQEALEVWVRVQANYIYLAPVMESDDIR